MRATSVSASVEFGLRLIGLWPGLWYGNFIYFAYISSMVIMLYLEFAYVYDHFDVKNITNIADALSIALAYSLGLLKVIFIWSNRRIFYNILLAIEEDWIDADRDKSVLCIMTSTANLLRHFSNVSIIINIIAGGTYFVTSFMRRAPNFKEDLNITSRTLPVKVEFPFEIDVSPFFELLIIGQCFHILLVSILAAVINCLIIILVFHVSGQIEILRRKLLTICENESSRSDSIVASVKFLIVRHQKIITVSDNIEILYSNIALMQFLLNSVLICCIGFTIIDSLAKGGIEMLLKSTIFYFAMALEAFIFCFAGEYLSAKSISIGDAVYESLWYNRTPAECRILLFVILRSQKRLTISAGSIIDLSLEGFTSLMKASASYMSVLHAMY